MTTEAKDSKSPMLPRRPTIHISGPVMGLVALLILFALLLASKGQLGNFLSLRNFQSLLHDATIPGVVALGMLLVIVSGGIDLSVGSVVALVTVVTMQVYREFEVTTGSMALASIAAISAGLVTGAFAGFLNGLAITQLRVTPFVATLGMLSIARGLAIWLSGRRNISFRGAVPPWVETLGHATVANGLFDLGVWSLLALAVLVAIVLRCSIFGRYCYAIGSNEATARLCGIEVERQKVWVYTVAGMVAGWAGVLVFAHTQSGNPNVSVGLELEVIAAVVIGGASLSGGVGTVIGTLLGVLILNVLTNGVVLLNQAIEVKYILIGAIVVINTALSQWQRRRAEAG